MIQVNNLQKLLTSVKYGLTMEMLLATIILGQDRLIQSNYTIKLSVIRDGKRGVFGIFKHKYKTVSRFYNQNFWDFYKMKLIDELLNQKTSEVENIMIPKLVK